MANKKQNESGNPIFEPDTFRLVLLCVVAIAIISAIGQVGVPFIVTAYLPDEAWPRFAPVVEAFKQTWNLSVIALLGLIGAKVMN